MNEDARTMAQLAETAEAEFMLAMSEAAPAGVRSQLGMRSGRVAGGVVCAMEHDPMGGFWSKALGQGFDVPLNKDAIDEVLAFFQQSRVPVAVVQPSPLADPPDWAQLLTERGLTPGRTWVKMIRPTTNLPSVSSDLEIRRIDASTAEAFARTYLRGFDMPDEGLFLEWFSALPTSPGWYCFGAWDWEELVSSANLFIAGEVAVLGGAATLEHARGRGAQSALMVARMRLAADMELRWLSTETGTETPEDPNPSLHNMRRLGFADLYERQNWIYHSVAVAD